MQPNEQAKTRERIRKYIRHRPERFEEARQWILKAFPTPKGPRRRSSPGGRERDCRVLVGIEFGERVRQLPRQTSAAGAIAVLRKGENNRSRGSGGEKV